jgi:hypothetical protein
MNHPEFLESVPLVPAPFTDPAIRLVHPESPETTSTPALLFVVFRDLLGEALSLL